MEPSFSRYIWKHTRPQQLWILCIVALSMLPYYLAFDLPKMIVNGPILGTGFATPEATQPFMPTALHIPYYGEVNLVGGMPLDRIDTLIGLSMAFLALVVINGLFKYYINIYKGLLGERLLRRIRFELVDRVLRFQPRSFKRIKGGEVASMIKDEVEPLGGFTGDAFVQPALLGGQAMTALAFIFVQNVWLGCIALFMAAVQIGVIPPLRRRLIELGRQRQVSARQLAGRVNEIVDGINAIHTNDTSNFERADVAHRLGTIFGIRYELYQRKFLVKFINNFLAQLTPFLFYTIGGYFTIMGQLDVGQLVAVINAYKELPGPLKELIDWDLARQDVQVRYEQVVDQFNNPDMLDPALQVVDTDHEPRLRLPVVVNGLTVDDEHGARRLDHVSLRVEPGETLAVLGDGGSGAEALAETLGRLAVPVSGKVLIGDHDLFHVPEGVAGRRITYASSDTYFFFGTLRENLLYSLKHAPLRPAAYEGKAAALRKRSRLESMKSGNPDLDLLADWIEPGSVTAVSGEGGLTGSMMAVLKLVRMTDTVMEFAMFSTLDVSTEPDLAEQILALRHDFRAELDRLGQSNLVIPYAVGAYNTEAPVLDNLLFGVFVNADNTEGQAEGARHFERLLRESGLSAELYAMGRAIAETTVELFGDVPADHSFFSRMNLMQQEDIPKFSALLRRTRAKKFADLDRDERIAFIELSFRYVEPHYRFGLLDKALMARIVEIRERMDSDFPLEVRELVERYDQNRYLKAGNLLDNILFGKVNQRFNDADRQIREVLIRVSEAKSDLFRRIFSVGLDYNLGASGRRLSVQQRQKVNFARALIRRSDIYVFNRALSALDPVLEENILRDTLEFLAAQGDEPTVVWVLTTHELAKYFQRLVMLDGGALVQETSSETAPRKSAIKSA